jgi:hypothetical protein
MTNHLKRVKSKEIDIYKLKRLTQEELDSIKSDKRIIAGVRKNLHEVIILSEDYNTHRNVPTVDLRTFVQDRNTGEMVPIRAGFRLDPSQYAVLLRMLKDHDELINGGIDEKSGEPLTTDQSYHLEEQIIK